jgi:hypothetical protein
MPCLVKRNNNIIDKVYLPDGKTESIIYKQLVEAVENIPSEFESYVTESIKPFVGKYISNIEDPSEVALGIYLNLQTNKFKDFFGGDWLKSKLNNTNKIGEPEIKNIDGIPSIINQEGKSISIFNTGNVSQDKSEIYRSIKTVKTKKLFSYVQTTLNVLELRIQDAVRARDALKQQNLNKEDFISRTKYYNDLISKTIEQKKVLRDNNTVDYITLIAEIDMDMVKDILGSKKTKLSDVVIALRATEAWKNMLGILGVNSLQDITDENTRNTIKNIISDAQDLEINIKELASKLLVKYSKDSKSKVPLTEKDLDAKRGLKDVSWIVSQARDLSNSGVGLADFLAKVISESNSKIDREHQANYRRIETEANRIKNHSEIRRNGFNIFLKEQTNSLGVKTLGLRGPYSQSYYDSLRIQKRKLNQERKEAGGDKEKVRKAFSDYNKWLYENTVLFNSIPFVEIDKHTDEERLKVIDSMKSMGFSDRDISDMIKSSVNLYQRFLDGVERYRIYLEADIENGDETIPEDKTKEEFIEEQIKNWKEEHDPLAYIRQLDNYSPGEKRAYKATYYTLQVPRRIIDNKDSGHYDKDFERVSADPELLRFYEFFKDFIDEQLSVLPQEEIEDLQSNFLPVITSRVATEFGLTNLKETAKGIGDWFFKHLTSVDFQRKEKLNPITGKPIHDFSARFVSENVSVDERSKDMVVMMKLFSDMALVYKHKNQVKDLVDITNDIIQNTEKTYKVDKKTGNTKVESRSPKNLQVMAESTINNSFYKLPKDRSDETAGRKFFNIFELLTGGLYKSPKYKKAKKLEEEIKELNDKIEEGNLTEAELSKIDGELSKLKTQYSGLGGRRFNFTRSADSLINLTRLTALGFQPFSALRNVMVGKVNNLIHAVGGQDFNSLELGKANRIITASTAKYISWGTVKSESAEKILRFLLDTGTVSGEDSMFVEGVVDKRSTWEQIKKVLPSPFTLMQSTDFHMKGEMAIATALNKKIKTSKGTVSFWEVIDKDLKYNEDKYGPWIPEENDNLTFEEFYNKEMNRIGQLSKKLHGFSGENLSLAGKDTVWGRLLFLFKTWLPETLASRFEGQRYDPLLERDVEGYYRTTVKAIRDQGFGAIGSMLKATFMKESGDMDPLERANLRKMFAELAAITTLAILILVLNSLVSDMDDDDERRRYMVMVNQLVLINRDLTYFININSFGDLTKNVIPAIRTIENFQAAGKASVYHLFGVENEDGELAYDSERTLLKISKALPVLNNINRLQYYEKELTDVR